MTILGKVSGETVKNEFSVFEDEENMHGVGGLYHRYYTFCSFSGISKGKERRGEGEHIDSHYSNLHNFPEVCRERSST